MIPRRICIVISDLGSGGAQKVATFLAREWIRKKHDVRFIVLGDKSQSFFAPPSESPVTYLEQTAPSLSIVRSMASNIQRTKMIRSEFKKIQPDVIVSFIAPTNCLCVLARLGINTKLIISERNDPFHQSFGLFWDFMRRVLYRYATIVSYNSPHVGSVLSSFVPKLKLRYTPNALEKTNENDVLDFEKREHLILCVGRLYPQKSFKTAIEAFDIFRKKHGDYKLVIVGDGPLKQDLQDLITTLELQSLVELVGRVVNPSEYYRRARFFVLPSAYEGTPNVLLEAMNYGCIPVISHTIESARDLVTSENGERFEYACAHELAEKLEKLANLNVKQQKQLSENARSSLAPYSPEKVMAVWDRILEEIL